MTPEEYILKRPTSRSGQLVKKTADTYNKMKSEALQSANVHHISWRTEAAHIWDWFIESNKDMPLMYPPNLVINTKEMPMIEVDDRYTVMCAELLQEWEIDNYGSDLLVIAMPSQINLIVYEKGVMANMRNIWGNHIPLGGAAVCISHILIHEYVHFITGHDIWSKMYKKFNKENRAAMFDYLDGKERGDYFDEVNTEMMTRSLLRKYWFKQLGSGPNSLQPVIGSRYDEFMRQKDRRYCDVMDAIEICEFSNHDYTPDEEIVDSKRLTLLIERGISHAKSDRVKIKLVK